MVSARQKRYSLAFAGSGSALPTVSVRPHQSNDNDGARLFRPCGLSRSRLRGRPAVRLRRDGTARARRRGRYRNRGVRRDRRRKRCGCAGFDNAPARRNADARRLVGRGRFVLRLVPRLVLRFGRHARERGGRVVVDRRPARRRAGFELRLECRLE
ncbi:hypothetical protein X962_5361 [Burkholderia pseudomallei MSHR7343]|nr:hypothetical protein X962_5361 [Burkholderia pseudomallei MSHR7343]